MKRAFYKILSITLVAMLMCSMLTLTASAATTKRIPVVTVKGIDAPVEGGYGDYTVTLGHPTYELVDVNDNEHINGIRWIDEDGNIMVPGIDRFRAGVKYTVAIHLISKYSYTFEPVSCTLDGEEVSWQGDLRIVQLTKTFEATEDLSDINTITFDYGFDGIKEYTFCNSGETIPYPDYYENGDLVLFDWYNDNEFTNKCDFEAPVYDNKTIYARYVDSADIVSVYMYTTDSDFPQSIEEAVIGDCLNVPDPEEEGMCFRGWYLDKEFTRPFYKNQSITEDISIYAKFVPLSEMHTVSLYYEDDTTPVSTFLIEDGYRYLITSKPSIEGKVFFGWFTDPERLTPYNSLQPITEDISIYAKSGQKIALVGATGAGKTTITNLLNRFYDITDGKVRYDGININKIKKDDLRASLGMVLQDTHLFTGTVMENIRYGRLDATDEEVYAAAKLANADGFIRMLSDGYNTVLKDGGSGLSQGQRQLLAIARAAICDPPVMILDEATSSIDTRTERIVQQGMDSLMKGRTVFVIAHRLSTIQNSDAIMVMDGGRIIERGNHEELMVKKGKYYQLYNGSFEPEEI